MGYYYDASLPPQPSYQNYTPDAEVFPFACLHCRQHKTKCVPPANYQQTYAPCGRCARKGYKCEYYMSMEPGPTHANAPAHQAAPELPYTGPPPSRSHPRYANGKYPDLSLRADSRSQTPKPHGAAFHQPGFTQTWDQRLGYGSAPHAMHTHSSGHYAPQYPVTDVSQYPPQNYQGYPSGY
ncbi:unnamed protein product [Mycena citricolor]|uniref:Zn(2)-C6 fungal-type domain-containing protein n=1 Tax=Mycena citricolor TaxID=2018698 RepID=A0AAD2HGQ4_9AGAR|nr:unnamed protein product [Mycena citricolor]